MKDSLMVWLLVGNYCHQHRKLNFCVRKENRCFQPIMAVFKNRRFYLFIKLFIYRITSNSKVRKPTRINGDKRLVNIAQRKCRSGQTGQTQALLA